VWKLAEGYLKAAVRICSLAGSAIIRIIVICRYSMILQEKPIGAFLYN
jgi:hypothetical protein